MTDEISEIYGVPEIFGDGVAEVHLIDNVLRFCFWQWERTNGGIMQRVCTAKARVTKQGMIASRPLITKALSELNGLAGEQGFRLTH